MDELCYWTIYTNLITTDEACITSTGSQNPTLTFVALTARAANHAVEEMKKENI